MSFANKPPTPNNATPEKKSAGVEQTLKFIEGHIREQPQSVQDIVRETRKNTPDAIPFYTTRNIQGKNFMFTEANSDKVLALVQDQKNPNKFKTRVFRFSGSDHQWKAYPGKRADETGSMKGEEDHPLHHYVQSAKLHKDIYKIINTLPQKYVSYSASKYIPIAKGKENNFTGRYADELEFKENYLTLENLEWRAFQKYCQEFYKIYDRFVGSAEASHNFSLDGGLYKWTVKLQSIPEFREIKKFIEYVNERYTHRNKPEFKESIKDTNLYALNASDNVMQKKLTEVYDENISSYIERGFKEVFPSSMLPDFSLKNRTDSYEKPGLSQRSTQGIKIEEYTVKSPDGDVLVFAMAYDQKGRVYIDNIYDPRVGMNDYGTLNKICQMGHLVYKPEDYEEQADFGFPQKYINPKNNGAYTDVSKLWENLAPIKKFKEELIRRGVFKIAR